MVFLDERTDRGEPPVLSLPGSSLEPAGHSSAPPSLGSDMWHAALQIAGDGDEGLLEFNGDTEVDCPTSGRRSLDADPTSGLKASGRRPGATRDSVQGASNMCPVNHPPAPCEPHSSARCNSRTHARTLR